MSTRKEADRTDKAITRRGRGKLMYGGLYPKTYSVKVELSDDGRSTTITRRAENMTGWELYGLLRVLMLEIEDQMRIRSDETLEIN